jgi:hypothetical protein
MLSTGRPLISRSLPTTNSCWTLPARTSLMPEHQILMLMRWSHLCRLIKPYNAGTWEMVLEGRQEITTGVEAAIEEEWGKNGVAFEPNVHYNIFPTAS